MHARFSYKRGIALAQLTLLEKTAQTVRKYDMIGQGDRVIVGVSGGADSVCLLDVLWKLSKEIPFSLRVVHVHHGLRAAADLDEAYVRDLCKERQIPIEAVHVDAAGYAAEHGETVEEAGRNLRQQAFAAAGSRWDEEEPYEGNVKIALAHHVEDLAETVIFHLCRGSSIAGLRGILPVSENRIRPLIEASREEIETYLKEEKISWQTDETNEDLEITRNYIRKETLPGLCRHVNAQTISHIARLAEDLCSTETYLEEVTAAEWKRCLTNTVSGKARQGALSVTKLQLQPVFLQKRILLLALANAAGKRKDLGAIHVEVLLRLLESQGSAQVDLPYGLTAYREYDALWIEGEEEKDKTDPSFQTTGVPLGENEYEMRVFTYEAGMDIPEATYTKWLDYDKITTFPMFRIRESGDRITISDDGTSKALTRYMIDAKIPKNVRDLYVLPTKEQEILWIPGYQMNAAYKVTETTKRVLEISWVKGVEPVKE